MLSDVLVVTHSHWDREWYLPAERSRQRLVALVDELLDDPPAHGESFLLDGQAILLEDYLDVRPERAEALSRLLHDGRIEAGPWYVLPDELIPSGEALVRNLLAGCNLVRRLGGEPPPVLYCPDSFGHPAVLPDLALGFGCRLVVLWRGYGSPRWPSGDTARWLGASGHAVVLHSLPPDGYEFGSSLPSDPPAARERWRRISDVLAPRATTGVALLMNGADHHARQRARAEAIRALDAAAQPVSVRPSTLRAASQVIVAAAGAAPLGEVRGELRDSYGYTWTLQGTLAARAAQKRRNALAERRLVRDAEPWIALAADGGGSATRALLRAAWRSLLQSHPHDTLCGTAIDAVAAAMESRLASTETQTRGLREDALLSLAGHDRELARNSPEEQWRPVVLLRNPSPRPRAGVAELLLSATVATVAVGPGSAERQGVPRRLPPWRVSGMPLQILARRERIALTEAPRAYPRAHRVAEVRALGWVESLPGYAVETRAQRGPANTTVPRPVRVEGLAMTNDLLRLSVAPSGDIRLEHQASGRVVERLLVLEQQVESGDLYTPSPREPLAPPRMRRVRTTLAGPLRGEITIDFMLGDGARGRGRCRLRLQLDAGLAALRVVLDGENLSGDHRLRLRVATGLAGAATVADAAFLPVSRAPLAVAEKDTRAERVVPTAPLHRWVARFGDMGGSTLFSDGLAEYESLDDGAIAVTILRAVGVLSRADLPERPGHAGWPADTPAAQALGAYAARFAIALHGPDSDEIRDSIERLADDVLLPIRAETLRSNLGGESRGGGLELVGDGLAFSAAMPAQREGWIVLRCVNRRDRATRGEWRLGRPIAEAVRARLDELPENPLAAVGGVVTFDAGPHEIVTILVR